MELEAIVEKLKKDERNLPYTERGIPPIFQISENAKILIVGQAPGRKVEETGIPFNNKLREKAAKSSWRARPH